MKKVLFGGLLFVCLLLVGTPSQAQSTGGMWPKEQVLTVLPPSTATAIDCCVLPFSKVFVDRRTHIHWDNQSGGDVKLIIGKGTNCKEISGESQVPYEVESSLGCYIIPMISKGKLSRPVALRDPGKYDYTIEYLGTDSTPRTGSVSVFGN